MIHALLDTNVILDALLERSPWETDAGAIMQADLDGQFVAYVTATSLTDIFYVTRRQAGRERAWELVQATLNQLSIISVGGDELEAAVMLEGNDFEDNLQIACAMSLQLDFIVTRDSSGFTGSPMPVLTPQQLLSRLSEDN